MLFRSHNPNYGNEQHAFPLRKVLVGTPGESHQGNSRDRRNGNGHNEGPDVVPDTQTVKQRHKHRSRQTQQELADDIKERSCMDHGIR